MTKSDAVLWEKQGYYILGVAKGFEVYAPDGCAAVRCAHIGFKGQAGFERAIAEAERRIAASPSEAAMPEIGFTEHCEKTFGPHWAICRDTDRNRLRWGRCITHREYVEARNTWKRENPTRATAAAHWG